MTQGPAFFQMGVPATETFPATLFARIRAKAVRVEASAAPIYPDRRGELELRREIAGYLAIARGIDCSPSQIIVTAGYSAGLGRAGAGIARSRRPGHPHRLVQQDDQSHAPPRIYRCADRPHGPLCRGCSVSRPAAGAFGAARDGGIHAGRPLSAPPPPFEARL